ncbi:hypothetical protein EDI_259480 [Entamoeba dispar SAW760]|uniref:Myb-like domain-containing protein n=1 Tax=Entamoeba dispar (strain ATCC PRA-260 / SAW760) TaxID=370354 RepID=B0EB67_ENTDS|nr:uncharacterized protein EDI_259480 [Entamoeba dispar SAW760]EDR28215.1 hypothetical protein EDI_259480 [Entamoeba dispar SAW760]|eukprot:EDR28215.1 hypothetical protein EDI_259480 [Entamoeba dispar SAW760]
MSFEEVNSNEYKNQIYSTFINQTQQIYNLEMMNEMLKQQLMSFSCNPLNTTQITSFDSLLVDSNPSEQSNEKPVQSMLQSRRYWSTEEHTKFIKAITWLGCTSTRRLPVKLISKFVGTRTPVQVRTHAQKFFDATEKASLGHKTNMTVSNCELTIEDVNELTKLKEEYTKNRFDITMF